MRHHVVKHSFGRKTGPRQALLRSLVNALVTHGRIRTTLPKAKELRRFAERAVTMGKKGTVHARRLLMARLDNLDSVKTLVDDLGQRFQSRPGGYTRIVKLGRRPGDNAEMAYIEWVDFKPAAADAPETVKGDSGAKKKAKTEAKTSAKTKKSSRQKEAKARKSARKKA